MFFDKMCEPGLATSPANPTREMFSRLRVSIGKSMMWRGALLSRCW
ncbi:hypothetical protein V6Z11_D02G168700 [Gossypium hirsutum]